MNLEQVVKKTVIAEANKNTPLGEFIPGTYHLPAKKITENGTFNGHLNFDFRESHSETVDVAEDYDQSFINIKFKGANKLSDKSEKFKSMTVHSLILILKNLVLIQNKRYNDFCNW